jgi:4-hydroxyphenylacetate 3-monooxygenase
VSVAKLYDALHDPKTRDVLTGPSDTGSGGYTHKFFKVARSREEVIAQRDAIAAWARISYGWMGRSPDYKAAFLNTLGANAEFYGKFADNARAWHRRGQEAVLYLNHCADQSADRPQQAARGGEGRLHHDPEGDRCRHLRVGRQGGGDQFGAHPLQFPRPEHGAGDHRSRHGGDVHRADEHARHQADLPRLLRIRRRATGSPFDYPLTSRFDENDAIFVFDNAFIPWENVLIHRDIERLKSFYPKSGLLQRLHHAGLHAARREARFHHRAALQGGARDRRRGVPRRAGADRRGDRLAQPVLVADRRDGVQSRCRGSTARCCRTRAPRAPTGCS